ncbi:MAG: E3 binding domain-containing protein, partial [Gammaproteobacteria bacterium]|nr:E3 binding domain-containing protein [Gammaproteobacteria bacterium]
MSLREVRIPDLGDATEVEVIEICVAVGQELEADDALIVIESDKASMEVPAPQAGVVVSIKSQLGDQVQTDDLILTMEVALAEEPSTVKVEEPAPQEQAPSDVPIVEQVAVTPEPIEEVGEVSEELLEVRVQDIGEAKDVVIIDILVKEGDDVEADDPLVVVESDKASMEIVAPAKGTIESLPVQLEQPIEEGTLVAVIRAMIVSKVDSPTTQTSEPTPHVPATTPAKPEPTETVQSAIRSLPDGKADSRHIYAGPAVRRLARELGVDLTKVNGSGSKGRITKDDVHAYVKAILTSG